jgi:hypothetical protein
MSIDAVVDTLLSIHGLPVVPTLSCGSAMPIVLDIVVAVDVYGMTTSNTIGSICVAWYILFHPKSRGERVVFIVFISAVKHQSITARFVGVLRADISTS